MKRFIGVVLCLLFSIVILNGCKKDEYTLNATVIKNDGIAFLVMEINVINGEIEVTINSKTEITDKNGKKISIDTILIGQEVEIYYDGLLALTYPRQMLQCYKGKIIN